MKIQAMTKQDKFERGLVEFLSKVLYIKVYYIVKNN